MDAINEDIWRRINRPHKSLQLDKVFQGIAEFSRTFEDELANRNHC